MFFSVSFFHFRLKHPSAATINISACQQVLKSTCGLAGGDGGGGERR